MGQSHAFGDRWFGDELTAESNGPASTQRPTTVKPPRGIVLAIVARRALSSSSSWLVQTRSGMLSIVELYSVVFHVALRLGVSLHFESGACGELPWSTSLDTTIALQRVWCVKIRTLASVVADHARFVGPATAPKARRWSSPEPSARSSIQPVASHVVGTIIAATTRPFCTLEDELRHAVSLSGLRQISAARLSMCGGLMDARPRGESRPSLISPCPPRFPGPWCWNEGAEEATRRTNGGIVARRPCRTTAWLLIPHDDGLGSRPTAAATADL